MKPTPQNNVGLTFLFRYVLSTLRFAPQKTVEIRKVRTANDNTKNILDNKFGIEVDYLGSRLMNLTTTLKNSYAPSGSRTAIAHCFTLSCRDLPSIRLERQ